MHLKITLKIVCLKMLYLIGPNGLVNRGFINFQKIVWMTIMCPTYAISLIRGQFHTYGMQILQVLSQRAS